MYVTQQLVSRTENRSLSICTRRTEQESRVPPAYPQHTSCRDTTVEVTARKCVAVEKDPIAHSHHSTIESFTIPSYQESLASAVELSPAH